MGTAAIVCNVVLLTFTCLVLATDGVSREVPYVAFTFLMLAVPILSVAVLVQLAVHRGGGGVDVSPAVRRASHVGVISNVALLVASCWAIYDQYPHPNEPGFLPYVAVVLITPILTVVALLVRASWSVGGSSRVA